MKNRNAGSYNQGCNELQELTEAINKAIANIYHTKITLIMNNPFFMWYYQNQDQVFNEGTFDYISRRVFPGDCRGTAELSPAGGGPNAYSQVVNDITYSLSTGDWIKIEEAQSKAAVQAQAIVRDYQDADAFGEITYLILVEAQKNYGEWAARTKFDYIITVILGIQWSGKKDPLTYTEMANAKNLRDLLPQAPNKADKIIEDVSGYLEIMKSVNELLDKVQQGSWEIAQLKNNTMYPSKSNGGMKTVDPITGKVGSMRQPGYTIDRKLEDIQSDLDNEQRIIKVEIHFQEKSQRGKPKSPCRKPAGLTVSMQSFSKKDIIYHDMLKIPGSSQEGSIVIEYRGYSMIPIAPLAWSPDTDTGWYFAKPITEAYINSKNDVTDFVFLGDTGYNLRSLADGGNFGFLRNLLICKEISGVSLNYKNADFEKFINYWKEYSDEEGRVNVFLTLFGVIKIGDGSKRFCYPGKVIPGPSNSEFSVIFSAPQGPSKVPLLQRTAYVIGGNFEFPAVNE
jgi:hypothetical protein